MKSPDNELYHMIGNNLRLARERILPKLSQDNLARRVGVTRASIVNIEAGRQRAPLHILWRISEALGVELTNLIPTSLELSKAATPIHLDGSDIEQIERAANGDPRTKRLLSEFVSRVKPRGEPFHD